MSGTVNISRRIWDDTAFKPEPFTEREAFIWLIMEASYKTRQKSAGDIWVKLERGQLVVSVRFMAEAWGWSKSKVHRFLKKAEKRDMIATESGTGINVITVCKYDDYQNKPDHTGTVKNKKRDSGGTAVGQQRDKPNTGVIQDAISSVTNVTVASDVDPAKIVFDSGIEILGGAGIAEPKARAILGKWRQVHGDSVVIAALGKAKREGAIDPVSFCVGIFRHVAKSVPRDGVVPSGALGS
jgi:hypothetical protein